MIRRAVTWNPSGAMENFTLYAAESGPLWLSSTGDIGRLDYKQYDTFISHKGDDTGLAVSVGKALNGQGIRGYLDRWDMSVTGDSPELEVYIRKVIRDTPSILAVVTENTPLSWWVPFELGVARETSSQIATFLFVEGRSRNNNVVTLPSYLKNWPILASAAELVEWARDMEFSRQASPFGRSNFGYFQKSADSTIGTEIDRLVSERRVRFVN